MGRYITEHSSTTAFVAQIKQRKIHDGGRDGNNDINEEGKERRKEGKKERKNGDMKSRNT